MPRTRLLSGVAAVLASIAVAAPAPADPIQQSQPDPLFPNMATDHCPGAKGNVGPEWQFCDGVKYPDGTYWRQNVFTTAAPELESDHPMSSGRHCVIDTKGDHSNDPNGFRSAMPSGCGRAPAR